MYRQGSELVPGGFDLSAVRHDYYRRKLSIDVRVPGELDAIKRVRAAACASLCLSVVLSVAVFELLLSPSFCVSVGVSDQ
jgi:hypothetical protein